MDGLQFRLAVCEGCVGSGGVIGPSRGYLSRGTEVTRQPCLLIYSCLTLNLAGGLDVMTWGRMGKGKERERERERELMAGKNWTPNVVTRRLHHT